MFFGCKCVIDKQPAQKFRVLSFHFFTKNDWNEHEIKKKNRERERKKKKKNLQQIALYMY